MVNARASVCGGRAFTKREQWPSFAHFKRALEDGFVAPEFQDVGLEFRAVIAPDTSLNMTTLNFHRRAKHQLSIGFIAGAMNEAHLRQYRGTTRFRYRLAACSLCRCERWTGGLSLRVHRGLLTVTFRPSLLTPHESAFGRQLQGDFHRPSWRGSHHPPLARRDAHRLLVPIKAVD